ncbi:MAG: nitrous oxide reductase accessory protein NosL [Cyclobacteriaceae bacterium]|nr:nitrous oxide reductase accessory protein NosL [Cyclobacteriaceae bacterium]
MKQLTVLVPLVLLFFTSSCQVKLEQINYGKDGCHFCKMTIVDNQHAAELVTNKGKVYKYDAIECMVNDLEQKNKGSIALLYVNDYSNPGEFVKAEEATYLISQKIPSPMGAFLSAFSLSENAEKTQAEMTGDLLTWEELLNRN